LSRRAGDIEAAQSLEDEGRDRADPGGDDRAM
jgi:hypothetical protein